MAIATPQHHAIVALFPQILFSRRRKWQGLQDVLSASGLERPALFLLVAIVQETDPGTALSREELEKRLFNPYATLYPMLAHLPELVKYGYLAHTDQDYVVTPEGRKFVEQEFEERARAYIATLTPLPEPELTRLTERLEEIAALMWQADEPALKAHQARVRRFLPVTMAMPVTVRLEASIMSFWMARDDAHIASWSAEGLSGPHLDLLSRLALEEAQTVPKLITLLEDTQHAQDVVRGLAVLAEAGYVRVEGEHVFLTETGREIRTHIEEETDRIYFAPWPELTGEELTWLHASLEVVRHSFANL